MAYVNEYHFGANLIVLCNEHSARGEYLEKESTGPCEDCGVQNCSLCDKTGKIECEECDGTSYIQVDCPDCIDSIIENENIECSTCLKERVIQDECLNCNEGEITCSSCEGNGYHD